MVQEAAHPDANIIFGANVDESLTDQVWVTVIATRFDGRGRRADGSGQRERRPLGRRRPRSVALRIAAPARRRASSRARGTSRSTFRSSCPGR